MVAIPMYMMETSYGQLIKCPLHNRFSIINPKLWGLGFCQALVDSLTVLYYVTLMPWSVSFLIDSFKNPLPWASDDSNSLWNKDYFHKETLQVSENISEPGGIVPMMAVCLLISYVVIYFSMWKGLRSTSKIIFVTVPLPYLLLTIFLIKGATLDGSGDGLRYLFVPDWSKLGNLKVWEDAIVQILYSSGIAFGPLMYYGTARKTTDKVINSSFWLPLINSATSLYAALVIFSFLGHISKTTGIPIGEISDGGLDLAFIAYPGLMTLLSWPNFWSVCFFLMLVSVGIDSIFGMFDFSLVYFADMFPAIRRKLRIEVYVLIACIVYFSLGLIFTMNSGFWLFKLFNSYAAGLTILYTMIAEIILVAWVFGLDRLDSLLQK